MNTCARAAKIVRTDVNSRRSADMTFDREVRTVVVKVNANDDTEEDTVNKGRLISREC